jgi:hypothetical protein
MTRHKARFLTLLAALTLMLTSFGPIGQSRSYAQGNSRTFPETGKTVSGRFLEYWNTHGELAQQGFPISEAMPEVSDTDGKTYIVQYFERAVFESHPEFAPPNDVLLSLLGVFLYKQKYPGGAPGQLPNAEANSHLFIETGKHVGGLFLTYWQTHGSVAQQGFPISEEFNEVSQLNGQTYKVQYFERAVFEWHPENAAPYNVLLSQLGTFRYRAKYLAPKPTNPPAATATPVPPTNIPAPTAGPCDGIPPSPHVVILVPDGSSFRESNCERPGIVFIAVADGFQANESVGVYITGPDQAVYGAPFQVHAGSDGSTTDDPVFFRSRTTDQLGIWAITFEGVNSHFKAIGYFKLRP